MDTDKAVLENAPARRNRVSALDLARGLAVLFMILIHVLVTLSAPEVMHSHFGWLIGFLGSPPGAPVFMTLMGISFYYSSHTDFMFGIRRGLKIILLGYILNILRGIIPLFLAQQFFPEKAAGIPPGLTDYADAFLELDILQFAGLSLIVMAFLRKYKVNKYIFPAGALAIALVSPHLWGITPDIPVVGHFLDYLWGDKPSVDPCVGNLVSFPFFPWFSFVLLGMFIGEILSKAQDTAQVLRRSGMAGFAVAAVAFAFIFPNFMFHLGDYYHSRPGIIIFHCGIVMAWLWLCQIATERIKMNPLFRIIFEWSRNVNSIYIIQWVLIMITADLILGFNKLSYGMTVAAMAGITAATHFISRLYISAEKSFKPAPHAAP